MRYIFLTFVLALLVGGRVTQAVTPPVIINEILWMGSTASTADEWLELRNTTDQEIDLSGWSITKRSNGVQVPMVTIPSGKRISAHGYFLISNYGPGDKSILSIVPDVIATDVALANTNLQLELRDNTATVVDVAGSGEGLALAGINNTTTHQIASMERNLEPGDGRQGNNWHSATSSANLLSTATERATPGVENSNGAPILNFDTSFSGTVDQPLLFDASDALDPENDPLIFSWTIGDLQLSGASISFVPKQVGDINGVIAITDSHQTVNWPFVVHVSAAGTSTVTGSPATQIIVTPCHDISFVELLPNPKGVDTSEFVVLKNNSNTVNTIDGCRLQINNTRQYQLTGTIVPNGEILLTKQRYRLPNSVATIDIVNSDGTSIDHVQYPKVKEGRSWSRIGSDWGWAPPTPTKKNAAFDPEEASVLGASTTTKETKLVTLGGRVIAQTGMIGTNYALVISDETMWFVRTIAGTTLPLHATISVVGKQSSYQGLPSVVVQGKPTIKSGSAVAVANVVLGDLDDRDGYRVVKVSGTIQAVRGASFDIEDATGQGTVTIKSASHIVRPVLRAGDQVAVTGIVTAGPTGLRILPRTKTDIEITHRTNAITPPTIQPVATTTAPVTWYWVAGVAGIAGVLLVRFLRSRKAHPTST